MADERMRVAGWRCVVCAATVDIDTAFPWRCPNSTDTDRHHVLALVNGDATTSSVGGGGSALVAHDSDLAWAAYASANGFDHAARVELVEATDDAVRRIAGTGFAPTPFARSAELSARLGFDAEGGVWVKDETAAVAGSQKARHLVTILLHLLAAEHIGHLVERPRLAIASCGNAALAASTLAAAVDWPIDVYVPTWMTDGFGTELNRLGATVHRCERRPADPPGDPAMLRFREAVAAGAIPFTVQGPENALCLDGGRTIGWEIAEQSRYGLDRIFVQVGGGAFAGCLGSGLRDLVPSTRLHAVQVEGCAPLARSWERAGLAPGAVVDDVAVVAELRALGRRWDRLMTVWDSPQSVADGILDDETYDWLAVIDAMRHSGGSPIVAAEVEVLHANELARSAGFDVSATGSAGLAGLLAVRGALAASERVAVVMSGVRR